jgi:hypothetical protein
MGEWSVGVPECWVGRASFQYSITPTLTLLSEVILHEERFQSF